MSKQTTSSSAGKDALPALEGPDRWHLYIGGHHDLSSKSIADEIRNALRNKFSEFHVYGRDEDADHAGHIRVIDQGIAECQKTLLVVSPEYINDKEVGRYERDKALKKAQYRGVNSLIILLLHGVHVEALGVKMRGYSILTYPEDDADKEKFHTQIQYLITQDCLPDPSSKPKDLMGYAMACSYFYGYLKCILPGLPDRIKKSRLMEMDGKLIMSSKLFIILPQSCYCPVKMQEQASEIFKKDIHHIPFNANRAGSASRDYKSVVYEIKKSHTDDTTLRVVMEYASCVAVLKDMMKDNDSSITQEEATREVQVFYFYLRCFLHAADDPFIDKIRLIYYNEYKDNLGSLIQVAVQEEINKEKAAGVKTDKMINSPSVPSGFSVEEDSDYLKVIHEKRFLAHYPLSTSGKRGKAYIINNMKFQKAETPLKERLGAPVDEREMSTLFEKLQFEVVTPKRDQTSEEMINWSSSLRTEDFSKDGAVIICLMSHGKHGVIFGKDGKTMRILHVTENLTANETLKNKPKIFFIQACQQGIEDEEKVQTVENTPETKKNQDVPAPKAEDSTDQSTGAGDQVMGSGDQPSIDTANWTVSYNGSSEPKLKCTYLNEELSKFVQKDESKKIILKGVVGPNSCAVTGSEIQDLATKVSTIHVDIPEPAACPHNPRGYPTSPSSTPTSPDIAGTDPFSKPSTVLQMDAGKPSGQAADSGTSEPTKRSDLVPGAPDFLMSYATLPGCLSYRHKELGSIYIKHLINKIDHLRESMPLDRILMTVTAAVKAEIGEYKLQDKQYPFHLLTTEHLIYL